MDEIGDMPLDIQTRLLHVSCLMANFYRVGGHSAVKVGCTYRCGNPPRFRKTGCMKLRFREDLFHRLNVIRIHSCAA
ncbi:sigma 54-interacting transcriptional regulator [Vibrio lentus]|nr:sigma 54-interacting transcriptional regulator [Vibrio lentus]